MKAVYLLPCSCGKKVRIDAGQAGARVSCECGKELTAPTFRALKDLEQETPSPAAAALATEPEWNPLRGVMFSLGMLLSLIAAVLLCYHLYQYWLMRDGGEPWKQDHLKEMREVVDYLAPADALADFQEMASKGLTVDGVPPWSQVAALRDSSRRWLTGALVTLAVGLFSLTASLIGTGRPKAK